MIREELERELQNIQAELEEVEETLAPHPFGSARCGRIRTRCAVDGDRLGAARDCNHRARRGIAKRQGINL